MPKVRLQKELENIKRESEAAFQIREEFVRWDNVKTAHDLVDDMEVARMLLDCYDLIGGNFLVWSDQAKLAPPPLHATLFLQHVSEEGWEVLQEIKALGGWRQDKDKDKTEPEQRKSKRKQARVRHIEPVQVKQEVVDPEDGEDRDSQDDDYVPSGDDDDDFVPEEEDIQPKRLTKMIRKPKSRPDRGKKATKKKVAQVEAQESDDDATEDEEKDEEEETSPQPAQRKRGRPKKREVRPPPPPRKSKKKKPKPEEQETYMSEDLETAEARSLVTRSEKEDTKTSKQLRRKKTEPAYKRRTQTLFQCKQCSKICESFVEFRTHYEIHLESNDNAESTVFRDSKFYNLLYHCKPCNKVLNEIEIVSHRNMHGEKVHKVCDICGMVFTIRGSWHKHIKKHEAKKTGNRFVCKLCGKTFPLIAWLKRHMQFHSKERPHICEVCGKGFKEHSGLLRHSKTHRSTKPHACQFCGKGFVAKDSLRGHERTHTGEKPFKCNLCSAAFTHNGTLTCHKKTAHGIDTSKDNKYQMVQEFDDINIQDPNMYENCSVRIATSAEETSTNSPQDNKHTSETKEGQREQSKPLVAPRDQDKNVSTYVEHIKSAAAQSVDSKLQASSSNIPVCEFDASTSGVFTSITSQGNQGNNEAEEAPVMSYTSL
ncbi:uncharacterized protein [Amphiura filiformis]|uniref:uncharacterized protein isoform X11 n=1 Tax=Amphiura filiformis TaxID=82378 RepID=UPI003B212161